MAKMIVTLKIMPESPEVDMKHMEHEVTKKIDHFTGEEAEKRVEIKPIAFGLKALQIMFVMDEKQGTTEPLEQEIAKVEGVHSVDVIDVRRAIG
jgi:elongation factor 1-beta